MAQCGNLSECCGKNSNSCCKCGSFIQALIIPIIIYVLIFTFHIVGYALPRWFTIEITDSSTGFVGYYHIGLWQDRICVREVCESATKQTVPAWLRAVQATETLGLVGLVAVGIICCAVFLCLQTEMSVNMKRAVAVVLICSGVCTTIGLLVFGIKGKMDTEALIKNLNVEFGRHTYLDIGFIMSLMGTALCLLLCAPLFLLDTRTYRPGASSQTLVHANEQQACNGAVRH